MILIFNDTINISIGLTFYLLSMIELIKTKYPYFPIFGISGFLIFFVISTTLYPGGSVNEMASVGYSHFHNFICDLMSLNLPEGTVNDARPVAIVAHFMLSFAMISFFYILPEIFKKQNRNTRIIRTSGMLSMVIFIFLFTDYHDLVVTISGVLTIFTFIPFFLELIDYEHKGLKALATICFILSLMMFLSYETKIGFYYAPFLQKITFLFDSAWIIWVSLIVASKRQVSVKSASL